MPVLYLVFIRGVNYNTLTSVAVSLARLPVLSSQQTETLRHRIHLWYVYSSPSTAGLLEKSLWSNLGQAGTSVLCLLHKYCKKKKKKGGKRGVLSPSVFCPHPFPILLFAIQTHSHPYPHPHHNCYSGKIFSPTFCWEKMSAPILLSVIFSSGHCCKCLTFAVFCTLSSFFSG